MPTLGAGGRLPRPLLRSLLVLFFGALLLPVAGSAQGANRAGVVVAMEDGQVVTACVAFDEPTISGLAL
ncbi:MAG TPA: hypothetical protein VLA19_28040, partial [Herpetosiphonaceae bacterium]|nr:hypothetical protein [Herpetosiphonaceae bacterium]